jgi:hypothetical protein
MKLAAFRAHLEARIAAQDPRDVRVIEELRAVLAVLGPDPRDAMPPGPQGVLPGLVAPAKVRRRSQHRFGLISWVTVPATGLVPEHLAALATCKACDCRRRRANTGVRLGARDTYSMDGETWSRVSPPCIPKARSR